MTNYETKCFACDRTLGVTAVLSGVYTEDGAQHVYIGRECLKHVKAAGADGYQPPKGGPRLVLTKPAVLS